MWTVHRIEPGRLSNCNIHIDGTTFNSIIKILTNLSA